MQKKRERERAGLVRTKQRQKGIRDPMIYGNAETRFHHGHATGASKVGMTLADSVSIQYHPASTPCRWSPSTTIPTATRDRVPRQRQRMPSPKKMMCHHVFSIFESWWSRLLGKTYIYINMYTGETSPTPQRRFLHHQSDAGSFIQVASACIHQSHRGSYRLEWVCLTFKALEIMLDDARQ